VLFAVEEMRAWSFWSLSGQVKGPHGKGTHGPVPPPWGLGEARARTPRKTVLKRVKMRFIFEKAQSSKFGGIKDVWVLWSE
jgi:hypothetical protein